MQVCKHCHLAGEGKYCSHCGETFQPDHITIHSILHEVVHTFTHADKGLLYTLKNLAIHPGTMQKNYLDGERKTNQKPFSLFFICASIAAIALHFVNTTPYGSQNHFDIVKENFYKNFFVILQAILLPVYAFLAWVFFGKKQINYAGMLVLTIYTISFSLLIIIPLNFTGLIPGFTYQQYLEVLFLSVYTILTNLNFFSFQNRWVVIIKSIAVLLLSYLLFNFMANQVINFML
ncbi:MAG: DUF3667 domain-containing protein [Ginsengibacter sp.]